MRIGQLGPLWYNIPPKKYGGTELVVYNLVNSLAEMGHKVTLFAPKTARVDKRIRLVPTVRRPLKEAGVEWTALPEPLSHIATAFDMVDQFDILHIHLNTLYDLITLPLSVRSSTPVIFTIHFDLEPKRDTGRKNLILKRFRDLPYVSISRSQKKDLNLNFVKTVYNGLDLGKYPFSAKADDYFAWMGRMAPWKGAREAIRAAQRAKVKLVLIGPYDPNVPVSLKYFKEEVKPLIDGKQITWTKDLGFKEKVAVVRKAKALLNPIRWHEPFGLVMAEAQALGTPVIAYNRGAASEVIHNWRSGFLAKSLPDMVQKILRVDELDRHAVRKNAERFSQEKMTTDYLEAYREVIKNWPTYLKNKRS